MCKICRTCLQSIEDHNFVDLNEDLTIRAKLGFCIPTMNAHFMPNPVMCMSCVNALNSAYEFTSRCLQIEEYLSKYVTVEKPQEANFDLKRSLVSENPMEQAEEDLSKSISTPVDVFDNNDVNSKDVFVSSEENSVLEQTLITEYASQDLTSLDRLQIVENFPDSYEYATSLYTCSDQISLPECRVVVTPLEVVIKENLKKVFWPTYNKPKCTSNTKEDAPRDNNNLLLRECSAVVTPLDYILRQTIRNYNL